MKASTLLLTSLLLTSAVTTRASIIAGESFNYSDGLLIGQTGSGMGFSGDWLGASYDATANGAPYFTISSSGLSMTGVYSSGGLVSSGNTAGFSRGVTRPFTSALSTGTLYGSYLFELNSNGTRGQTVSLVAVGGAAQGDNNAAFTWAGDGYTSATTNTAPGVRVAGSGWQTPANTLVNDQTYVMLYEFDATSKTTSAWVLNQAQLTNFYGSLDAATLNAAAGNTENPNGVAWKASVTNAGGTLDPMTNLTLIGFNSTMPSYTFKWDEIRFSDSSLFESVSVPEPSTIALFAMSSIGGIMVLRRRRKIS